jgi:hypothetical protein
VLKTLQSKCRPPGSEALPRGIVQDKSNLEMESMGGNPEREENGSGRRSKSLLAIPVGIKQKAVVDKLVSKVPAYQGQGPAFRCSVYARMLVRYSRRIVACLRLHAIVARRPAD